MGVTGEFPESGPYYDVVDPTDKDMQLRPDPSTVRIVPWATDPTAQVIHDCFDKDGNLVPFAPRSVLRRVCGLFEDKGWNPVVAPGTLMFYTGDAFPAWKGNGFVSGMGTQSINRIIFDGKGGAKPAEHPVK